MADRVTDKPSRTARLVLIAFLIGMASGALLALMAAQALQLRNAYSRGLMQVMQVHQRALHKATRAEGCASRAAGAQWRMLAGVSSSLSGELATRYEAGFGELANGLTQALAQPLDSDDCLAQIERVNEGCEACHQQYR